MTMQRSVADFPRNEPGLVDRFIGTAYDVVAAVGQNLDELRRLDGVLADIPVLAEQVAKDTLTEVFPEYESNLQLKVEEAGQVVADGEAAIAVVVADAAAQAEAAANSATDAANSAQDAAEIVAAAVNGVAELKADLLTGSEPNKGAGQVGFLNSTIYPSGTLGFVVAEGIGYQVKDVAALRLRSGTSVGERVYLLNYLSNDGKGARWLTWVLGTPKDNGGTYIAVAGNTTGYWVSDLSPEGRVDSTFFGMPYADGMNCYDAFNEMYLYCKDKRVDMYCGPGPTGRGRYNFGSASCPISGPRDPNLPMVAMHFGMWTTPAVTFETISNGGADVFNLCCMSDFFIRGFAKVNGTILTADGSGSNGVSMVFGGRNMVIELDPEDMPVVYKTDGGTDGGHGFTIQYGNGAIHPYESVVFRGSPKRCTSGVNIDFSPTNTVSYPHFGIVLDNVFIDQCFRGVTIGGTTPSSSIVDPQQLQPLIAVTGSVFIKNTQQSLLVLRSWGVDLNVKILNTFSAAELVRHPHNPTTRVAQILASKRCNIRVMGRIKDIGVLLEIGDISMGGLGYPQLDDSVVDFNVSYTTATTPILISSTSDTPCARSIIRLWGISTGWEDLVSKGLSSSVYINGTLITPTQFPGDSTVQAAGGNHCRMVYNVPLTSNRSVVAPSNPKVGDVVSIIRTSAATGSSSLIPFAGAALAAGSKSELMFTGSAWISIL